MKRYTVAGQPVESVGVWAGLAVVAAVLVWLLFFALPGRYRPESANNETTAGVADPALPEAAAEEAGRMAAKLFYVAGDGGSLVARDRDVPAADDPAEQARAIIRAQLADVEPPLVSAIPNGTTLRALFLTPRGEAYVDLSREVSEAHPGGSVAELLTVYSIVHALTANMPSITSVQILVDGREVDTLAGHVNLRRPMAPNPDWIQ